MSPAAAAARARRHPDGLGLTLAGEPVVCRPSGALWIESAGVLVAADLHLEKGSFFARRGAMLPPYDSQDALRRLTAEARALQAATVVMLGDSFHDLDGPDRLGADDLARLDALAGLADLVWIAGNHDPKTPDSLPGRATETLALGGLNLVHEPTRGAAPGQIAGHLHPCARVATRGASVRRRCFVTDGDRLILPAFGALAGGLNILDVAFAPLLTRPPLALVLGAGQVHAVSGAALRPD